MTTCCDHKHLLLELDEDNIPPVAKLVCRDCDSLIGKGDLHWADPYGVAPFYLAKDLKLAPRA